MTSNSIPDPATMDAELIRYLDGELDADERGRIDAALASDPVLADRLSTLRRRGQRLSALLADIDPGEGVTAAANPAGKAEAGATTTADVREIASARSRRTAGRTRLLRAAVVMLPLLGAALLVPPVRAWIVERLESIVPGPGSDDIVSPAPAAGSGAAAVYTFAVEGPVVEVELDAVQSAGVLTVRLADSPAATLEPISEGAGDPVLILPDGRVRIRNTSASAEGYRLTLPVSVSTLRIRIGDGTAREIRIDAGGGEITIPLSGAAS